MKILRPIPIILCLTLMVSMLAFPQVCKTGAINGILLCGNVIIPTLFPFSFCALFVMNSNICKKPSVLNKAAKKLFGLTSDEFSVFLLSLIGGYPIGATLLSDLYSQNKISENKISLMLCFSVNAGPAFIVMAIGQGFLNSKVLGYILLSAHILSSVILCFILSPFLKKDIIKITAANKKRIAISDNVVISAANAASSVFSVCGYVILFCAVNAVLNKLLENFNLLKNAIKLLEVTSAVSQSRNLYFIAFLVGFAGICIWCQILGVLKGIRINIPLLAFFRILHGALSCAVLFLLLKIFKPIMPTISNFTAFKGAATYSGAALSLSLTAMAVLFIVSSFKEKRL